MMERLEMSEGSAVLVSDRKVHPIQTAHRAILIISLGVIKCRRKGEMYAGLSQMCESGLYRTENYEKSAIDCSYSVIMLRMSKRKEDFR